MALVSTLSDVIGCVATLLAGHKPEGMSDNVLAGELRLPIMQAQAEVQRRLRISGVQQVRITTEGTYTALAETIDNESGTIQPTDLWDKAVGANDTEFRIVLESHDSQLDFTTPRERLTVWRYDGGSVKVRPCTTDRTYRQRGFMVTNAVNVPWANMVIGGANTTDEIWYPVLQFAAAEWLMAHEKRDAAKDRVATAERLIAQMEQESARMKQGRPVRRRPYYS